MAYVPMPMYAHVCVDIYTCPVSSSIPLHLFIYYLEMGPHRVAMTGLKLAVWTRLASAFPPLPHAESGVH